jgi:5'-3' exoribonuclease 1
MGVPKFYRFLSERYPLINQLIQDASLLPEVDNLYLDSNGIIHNATHGDGASRIQTMPDIMAAIMASIDYQVKLVSGGTPFLSGFLVLDSFP